MYNLPQRSDKMSFYLYDSMMFDTLRAMMKGKRSGQIKNIIKEGYDEKRGVWRGVMGTRLTHTKNPKRILWIDVSKRRRADTCQ